MILATFGPSSPHAGKQIVWQDGHMLVDGLALTFQQVFDFDARGELAWSYDGLQQWMSQLVQHQDAAAASSVAPVESPPAGTATTLVAMQPAPAPTQAPNLSAVPAGEYHGARQLAERRRTTPRDKSVAAALVLTFLFGPLGLFYCVAWWAALLMFVGAVVIALPHPRHRGCPILGGIDGLGRRRRKQATQRLSSVDRPAAADLHPAAAASLT